MANIYILLVFVPLIVAVLIVFARFSLLFLKKIDEGEEEGKLLRERQKEIVENMVEKGLSRIPPTAGFLWSTKRRKSF